MSVSSIQTALARLDETVEGLEQAVKTLSTKPKGGRRNTPQMDLFSAPLAAPAPITALDPAQIDQRLSRAIARIEDALKAS